jgi:hypothetical protein
VRQRLKRFLWGSVPERGKWGCMSGYVGVDAFHGPDYLSIERRCFLVRFARRFCGVAAGLSGSGSTILSSDVQATMNRHKLISPSKASVLDRKMKLPKSPLPTRVAALPRNSHASTNRKAIAPPRHRFEISFLRSLWMRRSRLVFMDIAPALGFQLGGHALVYSKRWGCCRR